jgi:hypothetical protein
MDREAGRSLSSTAQITDDRRTPPKRELRGLSRQANYTDRATPLGGDSANFCG